MKLLRMLLKTIQEGRSLTLSLSRLDKYHVKHIYFTISVSKKDSFFFVLLTCHPCFLSFFFFSFFIVYFYLHMWTLEDVFLDFPKNHSKDRVPPYLDFQWFEQQKPTPTKKKGRLRNGTFTSLQYRNKHHIISHLLCVYL